MTWLPWLLLLALGAATLWGYSTVATHVRWARRALLTKGDTPRPQGWLVHKLQLEELFDAIERRADGEGELRAKSARRIEALLAPLTDAVLVVDAQDRLRLANPAAVALFGLSEDYRDDSVIPLVRSADFIELIRRAREEGGARSTILLNRAPQADIWIQAAGTRTDPEAFGDGAAIFVLVDVTALKRLQAIERDFVTNVSHDLRTPVTILRGYAETLAEDQATMSAEDRARFAQKIVGSVGRLQGLVEGLLALASLESSRDVQREAGALHTAMREVSEEFTARCKAAGVKLELQLDADARAAADPVQARRLIQNLIDNGLSHASGLTRMTLSTSDTPNGVELSVEDDGAGVSPSDLPRLFDRFYRTDKSRRAGGNGLGLSIVRQVVELHGGTVTAELVHPKGLRIKVILPGTP
jgi:signal transduction histidine kinase